MSLGEASAGSRTSTLTTRSLGTGYMTLLGGSNSHLLLERLVEGSGASAGLCFALSDICKFSTPTRIQIYSQSLSHDGGRICYSCNDKSQDLTVTEEVIANLFQRRHRINNRKLEIKVSLQQVSHAGNWKCYSKVSYMCTVRYGRSSPRTRFFPSLVLRTRDRTCATVLIGVHRQEWNWSRFGHFSHRKAHCSRLGRRSDKTKHYQSKKMSTSFYHPIAPFNLHGKTLVVVSTTCLCSSRMARRGH
jgi:hypothetical protein